MSTVLGQISWSCATARAHRVLGLAPNPVTRRSSLLQPTSPTLVRVPSRSPAHDAIARRAHAKYVARGCIDGFDKEDWVAAREELLALSERK